MKTIPGVYRSFNARGFSLAEVTISLGIVSSILLPVIGLLATGTNLASVSQDQEASSRIAALVSESILPDRANGKHSILMLDNPASLPLDNSGKSTFLAFSSSGDYLREVTESEFSSGIRGEEEIFYLASATLQPVAPAAGSIQRSVPIFQLEIRVQHPAITAEGDRNDQLFTSRIVAP